MVMYFNVYKTHCRSDLAPRCEAVCLNGFGESSRAVFRLRQMTIGLSVSRLRDTNGRPDLIEKPIDGCLTASIPLTCCAMEHGD
jgi:hypothetical protein